MRKILGHVIGLVLATVLGASLATVAAPAHAAPAPASARAVTVPGAPDAVLTRLLVQRGFEDRVIVLTNRKRRAHGCAPLHASYALRMSARRHSVTMAEHGVMSHQLPGEPRFTVRITRAGYRGWTLVAENVARGFSTPGSVVKAWMQSPGHRANILNCRLRHIGVGIVLDGNQLWWTQNFGRP